MSDIVHELAQAGFRLFPLSGKKPDIKKGVDWKLLPKDDSLYAWDFAGNYAVHAENRLIIDIDCKHGQPGKASFKQLTKDIGETPGWESKTFVVRTGTGGFHIYFDVPLGSRIKLYHPSYPGLEFRYGPFYVVGPGSVHPETGKLYEAVFGFPKSLLSAPEKLLTLLDVPEVEHSGAQPEEGFEDDDPLNIKRFSEIITTMPEVQHGDRSNSIYIVACRGRDLGLSFEKCVEVIQKEYNSQKLTPPVDEGELEEVIKHAYKYARGKPGTLNIRSIFKTTKVGEDIGAVESLMYDTNKNAQPLKTLNNAVNYIGTLQPLKDVFRYNAFSGLIEISSHAPWFPERGDKGPNMCDEDVALLKYFLSRTVRVEFSQQILVEAAIVIAHKRHYHPVRNYLNNLNWDGFPRIDTWLTTYGHALDNPYTRSIGRKILCAAVRRVFEPGCKFDHVLIIEGSQGIGKSTLCRILGRSWGGDMNLDPHAKDSISMMMGKWIIELSEMTALRWADANALKSFISREKDTVRLPYQRHAKDFPRQSVFIGTVNPEHVGYLSDVTGNRRYWIVRFYGQVELTRFEDDCDQIWAEAKEAYQKEALYLSGDAHHMQIVEAQARMPEDPMRRNVLKYVRDNPDIIETSTDDILDYLGIPMKSVNRGDQSRIAQALIEMGWDKKHVREDGMFRTKYVRPLRDQWDMMLRDL